MSSIKAGGRNRLWPKCLKREKGEEVCLNEMMEAIGKTAILELETAADDFVKPADRDVDYSAIYEQ